MSETQQTAASIAARVKIQVGNPHRARVCGECANHGLNDKHRVCTSLVREMSGDRGEMCAWCCDKTCVDGFILLTFWAVLNGFVKATTRYFDKKFDVLMGSCWHVCVYGLKYILQTTNKHTRSSI